MYAIADNPYRQQSVETAGPAQLVLMLFDRALVGILRARQANGPGAFEVWNRELVRAQDILTELLVTLDHQAGGEIAANLSSLYTFCIERLIEANLRKDVAILDEVDALVRPIRDTWAEACCGMAPAQS